LVRTIAAGLLLLTPREDQPEITEIGLYAINGVDDCKKVGGSEPDIPIIILLMK
jgi:hypothetical protein